MKPYEQLATRSQHVLLRMEQLYKYVAENPCCPTTELVDDVGPSARGDLQRLWEDGRVIRYKLDDPRTSRELGMHPNSWLWITDEEGKQWEQEDLNL